MNIIIHDRHWRDENYRQRITTSEWKELLLTNEDKVTFEGRVRKLKAKNLGYGVVEIFKEPRKLKL